MNLLYSIRALLSHSNFANEYAFTRSNFQKEYGENLTLPYHTDRDDNNAARKEPKNGKPSS